MHKNPIHPLIPRALLAALLLPALTALADNSDPLIGGDLTRNFFGPGTGVIVGIVDSGITTSHPALSGLDSQGNPRLVAEQNFVSTEPDNTGEDVFGHGTAVTGVIGSSDPTDLGYAPDVRYVDARVLDSRNSFFDDNQIMSGFGFAISNHADIINASLNYGGLGGDGSSRLSMMVDFVEDNYGITVVVSAGNNGASTTAHTSNGPGDSFNAFSVAATSRASNFSQTATFSAYGTEIDGRSRPNISAPGDQIVTTSVTGSGFATWSGTSFAAPAVTGMLATQIEYGKNNNLSTDPMVIRATALNSAQKINDRNGNPWQPAAASTINNVYTITSPLDDNSGSGQINGTNLITQYSAGQHKPGPVPNTGWDLSTFPASTGTFDYAISSPLTAGQSLSATLTWNRHITWLDNNSDNIIDTFDTFLQLESLSNLDLALYLNNTLIADSISTVDNVEQINWPILTTGNYDLRVSRLFVGNAAPSEPFSLAWLTSTPAPEPASLLLLASGSLLLLRKNKESRHHS